MPISIKQINDSSLGRGGSSMCFVKDNAGLLYFCDYFSKSKAQVTADCYNLHGSPSKSVIYTDELSLYHGTVQLENTNLKLYFSEEGNLLLGTCEFYNEIMPHVLYYLESKDSTYELGDFYYVNSNHSLSEAPKNFKYKLKI
jgi:hypothetical protein